MIVIQVWTSKASATTRTVCPTSTRPTRLVSRKDLVLPKIDAKKMLNMWVWNWSRNYLILLGWFSTTSREEIREEDDDRFGEGWLVYWWEEKIKTWMYLKLKVPHLWSIILNWTIFQLLLKTSIVALLSGPRSKSIRISICSHGPLLIGKVGNTNRPSKYFRLDRQHSDNDTYMVFLIPLTFSKL